MDVAGSIESKQEHVLGKTREILYCSLDMGFYETVRRESEYFIREVKQSYEK